MHQEVLDDFHNHCLRSRVVKLQVNKYCAYQGLEYVAQNFNRVYLGFNEGLRVIEKQVVIF